jgi:CPA2 family monovalent cation:H+ antiporter-2
VPTSTQIIELGAVIFGLGVLGRLARRLKLSPIPLYLLAGLFFGKGGVRPLVTSADFLSISAEIGVILLLLLLGLEYSASELVTNLRTHAATGVADGVLNALPGAVTGVLLGFSAPAVVALAGITWVSSSGIAAKLLTDLGMLRNPETPAVLSVLVLEDLSMAIYLPILTAVLAGSGLLHGGVAVVVAVGALMIALAVALRLGPTISRLVFTPDDEVLLLLVFGLALLVAGLADKLQVSSAVGAFLVGIALSGRVARNVRETLSPLRDLFAALFFALFGLRTDPSAIPPVLGAAAALAAVTIVTKTAVGWWAARQAGAGPLGRLRAGTVIVARGEFSIVIAGLAAAGGAAAGVEPLAAAYVLIMAVIGPLLARGTEPAARLVLRHWARRRPVAARKAPPGGSDRRGGEEEHPDG